MVHKRRDRQGGSGAGRGTGPRQLRVGEELRHVLSRVLRDSELRDPALQGANITVTEVRMSPDLRTATVFVMPLGGANASEIAAALKRGAVYLRGLVAREVPLRYAPSLVFALDRTFDEADRIAALFARPEVERDLHPPRERRQEPDDAG